MGKITRNELAPVLTAELDTTAASITETGEKLDAVATKQTEILTSVNDVKTDTTAIKSDTTSIKADTQSILSQFPISGGVDWKNKTPKCAYGTSTSTSLTTVVSVSGQGYLTGICQFTHSSSYGGYIELIIDGVTFVPDTILFCGLGYSGSLNSIIRFNKSLAVRHKSTASSYTVNTKVYYLLD